MAPIYTVSNSYDTSEVFSYIHTYITDFKVVFGDYTHNGAMFASEKISQLNYRLQESLESGKEQADIYYQHEYVRDKLRYLILENAFIVSNIGYLYSQLDLLLKEISESTRVLFDSKIKLGDYHNKVKGRNNDIVKSRFYLTEVFRIDFSSIEVQWEDILNFKKVRNIVIHHNCVYFNDPVFMSYLNTRKTVKIVGKSLEFKQGYMDEVLELIELFLNKMMDLIYNKYMQLK